MRIAELFARVETKRFERPPRNPRSTWNEKNTLLVFVVADDGTVGVGEVWCEAISPRTLATFLVEDLAPLFRGAHVEDMQRLWRTAYERSFVSAKPGLTLSVLGVDPCLVFSIEGPAARDKFEDPILLDLRIASSVSAAAHGTLEIGRPEEGTRLLLRLPLAAA